MDHLDLEPMGNILRLSSIIKTKKKFIKFGDHNEDLKQSKKLLALSSLINTLQSPFYI